jgi:hypothetical protein
LDGTGLGLCPMVGCSFCSVEPSYSYTSVTFTKNVSRCSISSQNGQTCRNKLNILSSQFITDVLIRRHGPVRTLHCPGLPYLASHEKVSGGVGASPPSLTRSRTAVIIHSYSN